MTVPASALIHIFADYGQNYDHYGKCMFGSDIGNKIKYQYDDQLEIGWINSHPNLKRVGTVFGGGNIDFNIRHGPGNGLYQLNIRTFDISYSNNSSSNYSVPFHYIDPNTLTNNEIKEIHLELSNCFRAIIGKYGPQLEKRVIVGMVANKISRIRNFSERAVFIKSDIISRLIRDNIIKYHPEINDIYIISPIKLGSTILEQHQQQQQMFLEYKENELKALELKQKETFLEEQRKLEAKRDELATIEIERKTNALLEQQMILDLQQQKLELLKKEEQILLELKEKERDLNRKVNLKITVTKSSKKAFSKEVNSKIDKLRRSPRLN
jgi:hypothetical protein